MNQANNLDGINPPRLSVVILEKDLDNFKIFLERVSIKISISFQLTSCFEIIKITKIQRELNCWNQNVLMGVFLIHSIIVRILNGMSPKSVFFSQDTNKTSSLLNGKLITITLSR